MDENYPAIEKMKSVQKESQVIGDFLEWLDEQGLRICSIDDETGELHTAYCSIEKRLAIYFDIDLVEVDKEKRQILAGLRS